MAGRWALGQEGSSEVYRAESTCCTWQPDAELQLRKGRRAGTRLARRSGDECSTCGGNRCGTREAGNRRS